MLGFYIFLHIYRLWLSLISICRVSWTVCLIYTCFICSWCSILIHTIWECSPHLDLSTLNISRFPSESFLTQGVINIRIISYFIRIDAFRKCYLSKNQFSFIVINIITLDIYIVQYHSNCNIYCLSVLWQ